MSRTIYEYTVAVLPEPTSTPTDFVRSIVSADVGRLVDHVVASTHQRWLNEQAEQGWRLVSIYNGRAYLERAVERVES